jgi:hypothetical protein
MVAVLDKVVKTNGPVFVDGLEFLYWFLACD